MQVLLVTWLFLAGMEADLWQVITGLTSPAGATGAEVVASEGPYNPPPKP